jgi:hypothetical protein
VAYGARLESVLGASPQGFESLILRKLKGRQKAVFLFCWIFISPLIGSYVLLRQS